MKTRAWRIADAPSQHNCTRSRACDLLRRSHLRAEPHPLICMTALLYTMLTCLEVFTQLATLDDFVTCGSMVAQQGACQRVAGRRIQAFIRANRAASPPPRRVSR